MLSRLRSRFAAHLAFALALTCGAGAALAGNDDEGKQLFLEGRELFVAKRYDKALDKLSRSYAMVPSPNSGLIIARCLRELGRIEEATERFEATFSDAQARVTAGDDKYRGTAEAARLEGAALRARLGVLRLQIDGAPPGTVVETDVGQKPVGGGGMTDILHRPGDVRFVVRAPSRAPVRGDATLAAGRWTTVRVLLPADAAARQDPPVAQLRRAPEAETSAGSWMVPAGVALLGVGAVGVGAFVGFGLSSQAAYDDLEAGCTTQPCAPEWRDEADRGTRDQTIANVGLVVGGVGLAAGATLLVLGLGRRSAPASASIAVSPRAAYLRGRF